LNTISSYIVIVIVIGTVTLVVII